MAGNTFGKILTLTTFGESHGPAIGGILDGFPAGITIDREFLSVEMSRRKTGQSSYSTQRQEDDEVELLSGIFNDQSTGTPIGLLIRNKDHRSADYDRLKEIYRPGHADKVYDEKYGLRDYRGGGRSSARETAVRVAAGALAKMFLRLNNVRITAYVSSIKEIHTDKNYRALNLELIEQSTVRCPDEEISRQMLKVIEDAQKNGDTVGGTITCICSGIETGLGEPVYDKLDAVLAHAILSINATKGIEFDHGFASAQLLGSQNNPLPTGITGGISTGNDLVFRVAFKPVSSINKSQHTTDISGNEVVLEEVGGRHDACVLPRAVPIVEAMAALVIADMMLIKRTNRK